MRKIPLTQGKFAIVDDDWYEILSRRKWHANNKKRRNFYAFTNTSMKNGSQRTIISMHRLIMNPPKNKQVDHINGNTLDNRICNLRVCTNAENRKNGGKYFGKYSSKYKGVCWCKRDKIWKAEIKANSKHIYIGSFNNERQAMLAYNEAAKKYHGEFARLNEVLT